jgi:hypothetical protein
MLVNVNINITIKENNIMFTSKIVFVMFLLRSCNSSIQCNSNDLHIWNTNGKVNFPNEMQSCSTSCWGASHCVSKCIQDAEHYSVNCCDCFGNLASCTAKYCMSPCMKNKTSIECCSCIDSHCGISFTNCSGIDYHTLPNLSF